jgi:hypothetical protein
VLNSTESLSIIATTMEIVAEQRTSEVSSIQAVGHCARCGEPMISLPLLRCSHCDAIRLLQSWCYSPGPGLYLAECVDLDILTEGGTAEEAIAGLQSAVYGYLKVAFTGDTHGLVLRKSPLKNRLRYRAHRLWCFARSRFTGKHRHYVACFPTILKPRA